MKLFLVRCRGMQHSALGSNTGYGTAYVLADDPSAAYKRLRDDLDRRDMGFASDRVLESVTLLAEEGDYPECGTALYVSPATGGST